MSGNGDYISREAAITTYKTFGHLNLHNVIEAFNEIPAADVRHVVLCRDCLHVDCAMYHGPNWFCADGERRAES